MTIKKCSPAYPKMVPLLCCINSCYSTFAVGHGFGWSAGYWAGRLGSGAFLRHDPGRLRGQGDPGGPNQSLHGSGHPSAGEKVCGHQPEDPGGRSCAQEALCPVRCGPWALPWRSGQASGLKSNVFLLLWCLGSASTLVFMGQVQVNELSPLCECGSWQLCEHRPLSAWC